MRFGLKITRTVAVSTAYKHTSNGFAALVESEAEDGMECGIVVRNSGGINRTNFLFL
jgi:hypothetical protein